MSLAEQIENFIYKFPENIIVISSRPNRVFDSISEINSVNIEPFSKKQAISLINKLHYDKNQKKEFKRLLNDGLYDSHKSYLSNPLLCTIMLMTYEHGSEIPRKISIFFQRAYQTLYLRHDSLKGVAYKRKYATTLDEDDFKDVFSSFCFLTYVTSGSSFVEEDAISNAKKA